MAEGLPDLKSRVLIDTTQLDKLGSTVKGAMGSASAAFAGVGITAAVTKLFKGVIDEGTEAAKVGAQTAAVLKSTGGAAGVSAGDVEKLANKLSKLAGVDDEVIQQSENVLLTFTQVRNQVGAGNDVFDKATAAALDMSKALGQDLQASVIQIGKALQDPVAGLTALKRVGVEFTDQQKEQIKALVESGNQLGAQKLILHELQTEFGGTAAAVATPAEKMQVAWKNLQEHMATAVMPVLNGTVGVLGFLADAAQKVPSPVLAMVGAFAGVAGIALTLGKVIDVARSVRNTIDTVRVAVGGLRDLLGRFSWAQLAAGGAVAAGIGAAFIVIQKEQEGARSAADKWAQSFASSGGSVQERIKRVKDEIADLQHKASLQPATESGVGRFVNMLFGKDPNEFQNRADGLKKQLDSLTGRSDAVHAAAQQVGQAWADAADRTGVAADQIGAQADQLKKKHEDAAAAIQQAFAGLSVGAQDLAQQIAAPAEANADQLKQLADSVNKVRDAYGRLAPDSVQALVVLGAQGKLTADQLANIAQQAQQMRDGIASSFNSATSIVQAFGGQTTVTKEQVLQFFRDQLAAARDWSTNLQALMKAGIDQGLLGELAQAGPKAAPLVAALLAAVKSGNLGAINQAQADLRTLLGNTQNAVLGYETPFFIAGQTDGQGVAAGLGVGVGGAAGAMRAALQAAIDAARIFDYFHGLGSKAGTLFAGGLSEAIQKNIVTSFQGQGGAKVSLSAVVAQHNALGGVIRNGPVLSWLAENGPEVVIPLNDARRAAQLAARSGLLDMLTGASGGSAGDTSGLTAGAGPAPTGGAVYRIEVPLILDGQEFHRATVHISSRELEDRRVALS